MFLFLLNSSGAIILFVYLLISPLELRMRRTIPPERLKVKMWFYPVLTLLTAAAIVGGPRVDVRPRGDPLAAGSEPAGVGVLCSSRSSCSARPSGTPT